MNDEIRKFLSPSLKNAKDEELKKIGLASFGSNFSYLMAEKKNILEEFRKELNLSVDEEMDRVKFKFIVNYVEAYDENENKEVIINEEISFQREVPEKQLTPAEIIKMLNA